MTEQMAESHQNAATPYGPGWHHHNAGSLHPNDGCSACPERVTPPEGSSE